MKNLKDYLHFHIGSEIQYPDTDGKLIIARLTGVSRADGVETTYIKRKKKGHCMGDYLSWEPNGHHNSNALNIKPILRPLSNMTEDEAVELVKIRSTTYRWVTAEVVNQHILRFEFEYESSRRRRSTTLRFDELSPEEVRYLLSKGFDLFGLIEAGLAIDKTKLK
jgi:hypothetical protein